MKITGDHLGPNSDFDETFRNYAQECMHYEPAGYALNFKSKYEVHSFPHMNDSRFVTIYTNVKYRFCHHALKNLKLWTPPLFPLIFWLYLKAVPNIMLTRISSISNG